MCSPVCPLKIHNKIILKPYDDELPLPRLPLPFHSEVRDERVREQGVQPGTHAQVPGAPEEAQRPPGLRVLHDLRRAGRPHPPHHLAARQRQHQHQHQLPDLQHLRRVLPARTQGGAQGLRGVQGHSREQAGPGRVQHQAHRQR